MVTSREDAAFGPIVSLGLEGIPSEPLGDTVYRVPPLTTVDASAMVRDLKAAPVLFGRHGAPGVDVAGIEDLLHRVAQVADAIPQLASVTLSPCIASLNSVSVLGARILIAPPPTVGTRWPAIFDLCGSTPAGPAARAGRAGRCRRTVGVWRA